MSDNQVLSAELEFQIRQLVDASISEFRTELIAYIDEKCAAQHPAEEEEIEPLTLNMVMLQVAAIFEKFAHYDEIYRTYGIEADAFQDECNESIDLMKFKLEQFEIQLKEFQNRLLIEESGGDSAIQVNGELRKDFEALSKEVQETLNQFDQYFDQQVKSTEGIPEEIEDIKRQLASKQSKAEALIDAQENKKQLMVKLKLAVDQLNNQLPKVIAKQIAKG
ncbi:hypothetical protein [Oceanospirillum beijerinckii]|uniref:hypothetical protein n=1 Tax=Oceanospirillum beijerinckii TaxID=64976 RepID=UPI0003FAFF8C|nr:hypothetical protein [Oceanospirillum beijerinckii]